VERQPGPTQASDPRHYPCDMADLAHKTVLADEALECLEPRPGRLYVDGTVGGGGHSLRILEKSAPDGRLVAVDRDEIALDHARRRLADHAGRVTWVHATFGELDRVLDELGVAEVHGFLLDIGVSSLQMDDADRGFSFSRPGPIDMRMDPSRGSTALDLIRSRGADELAAILRDFGEERYARRIAERLKDDARHGRLVTTADLAGAVEACYPEAVRRRLRIHPATQTFQALRIAVNGELDELTRFLDFFPARLAAGGRCVIISFHSLEDRLVKHRFRELAWSSSLPPDLARAAGERVHPIVRPITRKAIVPSEAEVAANPRSRSAKLRACEKLGADGAVVS
jgi:16S rRNA (cytosine1402-N4)-methyltransferase